MKEQRESDNIYCNCVFVKFKSKLFFFIFAICLIGIGLFFGLNKLSCQRLTCIYLKNSNQYKIQNIYEENKYIFRALYENGNNLLRAEIRPDYTSQEANQAVQTQLTRTKGLFEDAAAPYPGEISAVISCSDEYKPVYSLIKQNGINISYFEGFVNDRLVFGSCVDDQAKYHDTLAMFYCEKQKKFYQIEVIIPRENYINNKQENDSILNSLGCK